MVKYSFSCKLCNVIKIINMTVEEYIDSKSKLKCDECGGNIKRVYKNFNFKVDKDSKDILMDIKEENQKIIEKINSGDIKTITDIYGND